MLRITIEITGETSRRFLLEAHGPDHARLLTLPLPYGERVGVRGGPPGWNSSRPPGGGTSWNLSCGAQLGGRRMAIGRPSPRPLPDDTRGRSHPPSICFLPISQADEFSFCIRTDHYDYLMINRPAYRRPHFLACNPFLAAKRMSALPTVSARARLTARLCAEGACRVGKPCRRLVLLYFPAAGAAGAKELSSYGESESPPRVRSRPCRPRKRN